MFSEVTARFYQIRFTYIILEFVLYKYDFKIFLKCAFILKLIWL